MSEEINDLIDELDDSEELILDNISTEKPMLTYDEKIIQKIQGFPSTRCYGCNTVLSPATALTDFTLTSPKGAMVPYRCPNDNKISWIYGDL